jgi:ParB-like chromosome segregation protein Spo0J
MKMHPHHEIADSWPMLPRAALEAMAEDISENGQWEPIELYQGEVLDGRNRQAACKLAGVKPLFLDVTGDLAACNLIRYVTSKNGLRRHLTATEIAMSVAKMNKTKYAHMYSQSPANGGHGVSKETPHHPTVGELAKEAGVSKTSVNRATKVLKSAAPEVKEALDEGKVSLTKAASIASLPPKEQKKEVAKPKQGKVVKSPGALKKEARGHWGNVVRALHDLGLKEKLTPEVRAITEALK